MLWHMLIKMGKNVELKKNSNSEEVLRSEINQIMNPNN